MATETLCGHIEVAPGMVGGKPCIAGRKITVQNVVWHERMGRSANEIATEYRLMLANVYAALTYYSDHREQIDHLIRYGEAYAKEFCERIPSKMWQNAPSG